MTPAVSYLRMSTDKQDTSIAAQRSAVQDLARRHGYKIIREYVDSGVSGDATEKRYEFQRMLASADSGEFRAVLCWDQDRFGRFDPLEAGYWIKPLRDNGIQLVTVAQGVINWNDIAGRLLYTVQQEGKHQFLRDLSRNCMRGMLAKAKQGLWLTGDPPYGFRVGADQKLVLEESEASVVREIFKAYLSGMSLRRIANDLNAKGIPSPRGSAWHSTSVYRCLRNPAVIGQLRFNRTTESKYTTVEGGAVVAKTLATSGVNDPDEWVVVEHAHPAIISLATFNKVAKRFGEQLKFPGPTSKHLSLFKGLLFCGYCGHSMHGGWAAKAADMAYVCSWNKHTGKCTSNRTHQKDLLSLIQQTLKDEYLSRKAIAAAKATIIENLSVESGPNPDQARRALDAQRAKLQKAEQRLMEVDKDLVKTVSAQIRVIRQSVEQAEAVYRAACVPRKSVKAEQLAALDSIIDAYRKIVSGDTDQPLDGLAPILRESIERIEVTSVKDPPGYRTPTGLYRIIKVKVTTKNAGKTP